MVNFYVVMLIFVLMVFAQEIWVGRKLRDLEKRVKFWETRVQALIVKYYTDKGGL